MPVLTHPLRVGAAVALLLASGGAAAGPLEGLDQVLPERTGARGQLLPWRFEVRASAAELKAAAVTPALQRAWERQLQGLAAAVQKAPVLAAARGFHPRLGGWLELEPSAAAPARAALRGGLRVEAFAPDQVARGRGGGLAPRPGVVVPALELRLNQPLEAAALGGEGWMQDEQGAFFAARPRARVQGFPVLGRELWVWPPGAPAFRPVSRRRVAEAFLRGHPRHTGSLARLCARYAALQDAVSPEALAGPASLGPDEEEPPLVGDDFPGAREVLAPAPGAIDAGASRLELTLARVGDLEVVARAGSLPPGAPERVYLEVLQQVDWRGLLRAAGR